MLFGTLIASYHLHMITSQCKTFCFVKKVFVCRRGDTCKEDTAVGGWWVCPRWVCRVSGELKYCSVALSKSIPLTNNYANIVDLASAVEIGQL
jgi:hypothetical protein